MVAGVLNSLLQVMISISVVRANSAWNALTHTPVGYIHGSANIELGSCWGIEGRNLEYSTCTVGSLAEGPRPPRKLRRFKMPNSACFLHACSCSDDRRSTLLFPLVFF